MAHDFVLTPGCSNPHEMAVIAIMYQNEDDLRAALAAGADADASVTSGNFIPMLSYAAAHGYVRSCEVLVAAGANVNARARDDSWPDGVGFSALQSALGDLTDAHEACARILLQAGADPNTPFSSLPGSQTTWSCVALHFVIPSSGQRVVQMLIEHGADLELKNSQGRTALQLAIFNNERKIALTLLRAGAAAKASRRHEIRDTNAALSDFMADMINDGGWNARVQRHRDRLLGVVSRLRLPHDVNVAILGFWSPPGGH